MITIKSEREIELMRQAGMLVSKMHQFIKPYIIPKFISTTFACIDYTDDIVFLDNFGETKINIKLSNVEKFDFKIEMDYSAESVPNNNGKITYNFKTIDGFTYSEYGFSLGTWLVNQRRQYRLGSLSRNKIKKLEKWLFVV